MRELLPTPASPGRPSSSSFAFAATISFSRTRSLRSLARSHRDSHSCARARASNFRFIFIKGLRDVPSDFPRDVATASPFIAIRSGIHLSRGAMNLTSPRIDGRRRQRCAPAAETAGLETGGDRRFSWLIAATLLGISYCRDGISVISQTCASHACVAFTPRGKSFNCSRECAQSLNCSQWLQSYSFIEKNNSNDIRGCKVVINNALLNLLRGQVDCNRFAR